MDSFTTPEYDSEQSALANELEGDKPKVEISVPQDPEVNPEIYRDVESLLFKGFITVSAKINNVHFVFKSLNQHEMDYLWLQHGETTVTHEFWNLFLAHGVFLVGGTNVLVNRVKNLPKIADVFNTLDPNSKNKIIWHLSEINRRASNAVALTECYAMERYSRYRWYQLHGIEATNLSVTGIQGTDQLGLNWGQLIWRALNHIEDLNDAQENSWDHAKFIGSCFAGKGISKVYQQDTQRKKQAKEERLARKDKILREILFGEKTHEVAQLGRAVLVGPKTVEELARQVQNDLSGEKDWHDRVVDEHEQRIKAGRNQQLEHIAELAAEREREFGGKTLIGGTEMRGYSRGEINEFLRQQKVREAEHDIQRNQRPELHDERLKGAIDRYILTDNPPKE